MNIEEIFRWDREESKKYDAWSLWARFEIPNENEDWKYRDWLSSRLEEFCKVTDPKRGSWNCAMLDGRSDQQGGIGMLQIGEHFFGGCELYWFDGSRVELFGHNKGLLFRDHEDMTSFRTFTIYICADAFAEFLKKQQIPFQCYRRRRDSRIESLHDFYPPIA